MNNISISLSESGPSRDISEIRIDGVIDTITAGEFEEVLDSLLKRGRHRIVVDLAGVEYISSAGWGIFISHIKEVRSHEGDIKLAGMVSNVYEIYELLEFDNVLQALPTVEEARNSFGPGAVPSPREGIEPEQTRMTVVDGLAESARPAGVSKPDPVITTEAAPPADPEAAVLHAVRQDPFLSIAEIRDEINSRPRSDDVGWWQVFSILRRNHLLSKRSRFRFARPRH